MTKSPTKKKMNSSENEQDDTVEEVTEDLGHKDHTVEVITKHNDGEKTLKDAVKPKKKRKSNKRN